EAGEEKAFGLASGRAGGFVFRQNPGHSRPVRDGADDRARRGLFGAGRPRGGRGVRLAHLETHVGPGVCRIAGAIPGWSRGDPGRSVGIRAGPRRVYAAGPPIYNNLGWGLWKRGAVMK